MDNSGIETAIISNPSNWTPFPLQEARDLARESNEFAAEMRQAHPDRFGVFASLPMPDIDASLREIEYAFETLKVDGINTTTNFGDKWPGDEMFDPVLGELDKRSAIVFVHPQAPQALIGITPPVPDATVEFMFDVVRCITSMLFRGTFTRFRNIRFVFTHGGGGLPALAERIDRTTRNQRAVAERLPQGALAELRRLHFDMTTTTSRPAVEALRAFIPATQLLFGSDYPFMPPEATLRGLDQCGFADDELAAIYHGNAATLFPRIKAA